MIRLATPADRASICRLHLEASRRQPGAFFHRLGLPFLRAYHRTFAEVPGAVVVVATDPDGRVIGFIAGSLDAAAELEAFRRHRVRLGLAALGALLRAPRLWGEVLGRYRTVRGDGEERVLTSGARLAYWACDPGHGARALHLLEALLAVLRDLGAGPVRCEVDLGTPVLRLHQGLGGRVVRTFRMSDGRERALVEHPDPGARP